MTCAARPTFNPAQGGEDVGYYRMKEGTRQLSVRDLAGHTRLKLRAQGQGSSAEVSGKDMVAELKEREMRAKDKSILSGKAEPSETASSVFEGGGGVRGVLENAQRDADDVVPEAESDDDSSDDDDEDETAELMKELERIKREREEEAAAKAIEEQARLEQERKEAMLRGNPLLGGAAAAGGAMGVKRRWDDDVVFRHQARNEPEAKKRFINDTIRNDFHRKFLNKYVK
uniref:Cwf15/Cwc15 cell cycle control protein n=1 Tax=Hemiselmis andersenii TaxID=464988 RepID=A0A7S1DIM2_HEMAN|mmetsp:Transcript_14304/g.34836  ORF Transcript_14304/g.34836 Transcript_14304/m.34836 type:complete len:229 (+) Transcript_14304:52-738(+)|eukprot:CAMPEP_0114128894 /NCGR_PEP_ID=MMETSP0043_2-20121206/11184_1 /TAXON_ID=464988 /ORGANISM="Hemiselmis andersenii, Strain CCMP644" /LENGTH=228 /DNA_ID=CAMNT_0001222131 /DNA_START=35 /DNA_END=721 /DNA_ORIENTATION=-